MDSSSPGVEAGATAGIAQKSNVGEVTRSASISKDGGRMSSKDMFIRVDKIDLKSLDYQLEKHLSRVWSRGIQRPKEEWEIDLSTLDIKNVIAHGTYGTLYRGVYDEQDVADQVPSLSWFLQVLIMGEANQEETQPAAKAEENKVEEKPEEKKEETNPLPIPIILGVDMHCVGCARKVEQAIMKVRGVEAVEIDMIQNQVKVKGIVDPQALCLRIQRKTKRKAIVLSPLPPENGDNTKPVVVTSQVSELTTVELNVNMHCEACAQQLKRKILRMRGVQTAETELASGKVTVTGTMDANKLVEYVYRRTRKLARIVPQPEKEEEKKEEAAGGEKAQEEAKPEEKKEENEEKKEENEEKKDGEKKPPEAETDDNNKNKDETDKDSKKNDEEKKEGAGEEQKKEGDENSEENLKKVMYYTTPMYVFEYVPPPQIFSDENPNACCIS